MKTILKPLFFFCLSILTFPLFTSAQSQIDSTGFDGDHFSLEGALSLFEDAKSIEDFEKALNTESNHINNLDLDRDGKTDYVLVQDHVSDDIHAIVLQVALSKTEVQDIAVIEIEKTGKEEAILQILGDEDIYGSQKIVEPFQMKESTTGKGPSADLSIARIVVNVWGWPSVRFVYGPRYRPYVSPFGWQTYPRYWKPWRPHSLRFHYTHRVFKPHFHVVSTHRVVRAHKVYRPLRRSSTVVRTRTTVVRNRRGNVIGTKTVRKKTVRGKKGKVVRKKKAVKRRRRN